MYYSHVEIEYVAMSFSPARTDLALKLLKSIGTLFLRNGPKKLLAREPLDTSSGRCIGKFSSVGRNVGNDLTHTFLGAAP